MEVIPPRRRNLAQPNLHTIFSLASRKVRQPRAAMLQQEAKVEYGGCNATECLACEQSERTDIHLLLKAKRGCQEKVKDDPSPANLAALSRSKKMLDEAMSKTRLTTKTLPNVKKGSVGIFTRPRPQDWPG